eukprot:COSAG05_NODE_371_length_10705_cov_99.051475_10_plen_62_part_00
MCVCVNVCVCVCVCVDLSLCVQGEYFCKKCPELERKAVMALKDEFTKFDTFKQGTINIRPF